MMMQQNYETFEVFLALLNQLIDNEVKKKKHVKHMCFNIKDQVHLFKKDTTESFDYVLHPPTDYHASIHIQDPYY